MQNARIILLCTVLLTSCSGSEDFEIESLSKKYSIEELLLFSESGFAYKDKVFKWKDDITISYTGYSGANDIKNIDSLIEEFEPLLNGLTITRVKEKGNIEFNFTPDFTDSEHTMAQGKTSKKVKTFFDCKIYKATVYIMPNLAESDRKETMRHEFMHALGLMHSPTIQNTILSDKTVYKSLDEYIEKGMAYEKISGLDKSLVSILYEDSVPFGLQRSEFKKTT